MVDAPPPPDVRPVPVVLGICDAQGRPWAAPIEAEAAPDLDALQPFVVRSPPCAADPAASALMPGVPTGGVIIDGRSGQTFGFSGRFAVTPENRLTVVLRDGVRRGDRHDRVRVASATISAGEPEVRRGSALNKAECAQVAAASVAYVATRTSAPDGTLATVPVTVHAGRPVSVLVAHESCLLVPVYDGPARTEVLENLSEDPRIGVLIVDTRSGATVQVTGDADVLRADYHISRFDNAVAVLAIAVRETVSIGPRVASAMHFDAPPPQVDAQTPSRTVPTLSGRLHTVNVSFARTVEHNGRAVATGIFKTPTDGSVPLRRLNLEGDGQADLWGHGGAFRAVYAYPHEHYDYWAEALGRDDLTAGQFGENFTVEGLDEDNVMVGDVFRINDTVLEVSQPRIPCFKLAIKMGLPNFQKRFLEEGRVGFYFRVLNEGAIEPGSTIDLIDRPSNALSVRHVHELLFFRTEDLAGTRRALSIPALAHGWKGSFEARLAKARSEDRTHRTLVVTRRVKESTTVTSFYLAPTDGDPPAAFKAGQFLPVQLEIPGRSDPVWRTYSLSARPGRGEYRISVKRETPPAESPSAPPGLASSYLHDHVGVGTTLISAPLGADLSCRPTRQKRERSF